MLVPLKFVRTVLSRLLSLQQGSGKSIREQNEVIRQFQTINKRLGLGFIKPVHKELEHILQTGDQFTLRKPVLELLVWLSDQDNIAETEKCLQYIETYEARVTGSLNKNLSRRIAIVSAEILLAVGNRTAAKECITKCLVRDKHPDLFFAAANTVNSTTEKIEWINQVFLLYNYSPITLEPTSNKPVFDHISKKIPENLTTGLQPLISVIIPAYNCASTISTSIESMLSQTWHNLEILIVDDCSSDDTENIISKYATMDSRVRLIKVRENGGTYKARNMALAQAKGEFITCHDADDWSHPQKLEVQAEHLLGNPSVIANTSQKVRTRNNLDFYRMGKFGRFIGMSISSLMFRRQPVCEKLGFWDHVRFGADNEFFTRLKILFGEENCVRLNTGPLSFLRQTNTSLTGRSDFGYHGMFYGARKEYNESYEHFHSQVSDSSLKYPQVWEQRPFPVPDPMRPVREKSINGYRKFDVIIVSDFRLKAEAEITNINEILNYRKQGKRVGLIQLALYNYVDHLKITSAIRELLDGNNLQILVYGEQIVAETVIVRFADVLQEWQRYIPAVKAENVCIVINENSIFSNNMDTGQQQDYNDYQKRIYSYFSCNAVWYPENTVVRNNLYKQNNNGFESISISNLDWATCT